MPLRNDQVNTQNQVEEDSTVVTADASDEDGVAAEARTTASRVARSEKIYVSRLALAPLRLPSGTKAIFTLPEARTLASEVDTAFRSALGEDNRVLEVLPRREEHVDNARTEQLFDVDPSATDIVEAVVPYEAMRLNSPIEFRVRVPRKNQPMYRSMDDVPSDDYLVLWDGITLAVQWLQLKPRATGSGGHVVLDIIHDVAIRAGYSVEIIACSRGCHHRFLHLDFITFDATGHPDHYHILGDSPVGKSAATPFDFPDVDLDLIRAHFRDVNMLMAYFARTKTLADTIAYLESKSRSDSKKMLILAYQRAAMPPARKVIQSLKARWTLRHSARETRKLVAAQWLALASVDSYGRQWRHYFRVFDARVNAPLFRETKEFFDTGENLVENIDLSIISSSVTEVASRSEGRILIWSTLAGAGAGLAGATLAALLSLGQHSV